MNYGGTMEEGAMKKGALRNISLPWRFLEYKRSFVAHLKQTNLILRVGTPKGLVCMRKNTSDSWDSLRCINSMYRMYVSVHPKLRNSTAHPLNPKSVQFLFLYFEIYLHGSTIIIHFPGRMLCLLLIFKQIM